MSCRLCCCRSRKSQGPPAGKWMNGKFWLIVSDPCGLFMGTMVYAVALQTAFLVNVYILLPDMSGILDLLQAVGYNVLLGLMLWSHFRCMTTNPGTAFDHIDEDIQATMRAEYISQKEGTLDDSLGPNAKRKWFCTKCSSYRPKRTHHCSTCRSCVLDMDHHCPWMNNCVGWRNHKYFLLFLVYAGLECTWSFLLVGYSLLYMPEEDSFVPQSAVQGFRLLKEHFGTLPESPWAIIWSIMMALVCFFLTIFVLVMSCDQWEYLSRGYGAVDKKMMMAAAAAAAASAKEADLKAKGTAEAEAKAETGEAQANVKEEKQQQHQQQQQQQQLPQQQRQEEADRAARAVSGTSASQSADRGNLQTSTTGPSSSTSNQSWNAAASAPPKLCNCNRFLTVMGDAGGPCNWRWAVPLAPGPRHLYDLQEDPLVRLARRRRTGRTKTAQREEAPGHDAPLSPDAAGGCSRARFAVPDALPPQPELPLLLQEQHQPDLAAGPPPSSSNLAATTANANAIASGNANANGSIFAASASSSSSSSSSHLPGESKAHSSAGTDCLQAAKSPLLEGAPRSPGTRNLFGDDSDDESDDSGSLDDSEISDLADFDFEEEVPITTSPNATTTATSQHPCTVPETKAAPPAAAVSAVE